MAGGENKGYAMQLMLDEMGERRFHLAGHAPERTCEDEAQPAEGGA